MTSMWDQLNKDIDAVMSRDPAAKSRLEVLLCYPGLWAVRAHRRAHRHYAKGRVLLARLISQRARRRTGIEIHPGARIGQGVFIDHGDGVVIGETAVIGDNVTLYQGVTLGGTGKETGKRHPNIGSGVTIGAGAKVLGPITIGDNSKVGAGAIVLKDVPPNCTVVGNPGRVVQKKQPPMLGEIDLDQVNLPDPMLERMEELLSRLSCLERCLRHHAKALNCDGCDDGDFEKCPEPNPAPGEESPGGMPK
jgi:serine O-acetyltransferase